MNPEVAMTLDESVEEVLGLLTGLGLTYAPEMDRYRAVTRQLNRALRANALEREWSYYADIEDVGVARAGQQDVTLRRSVRPRVMGDDAVQLVTPDGTPAAWAFFLPRDAIGKYPLRRGLWVSVTKNRLHFSRPFRRDEEGLRIRLPVMREPRMFRLPALPSDPNEEVPAVPTEVREQLLDFEFPDLVIQRAAWLYAQTDPVMQPRVPALEDQYKTLFYALNERDDRHTDSPFMNEWTVPIQSDINGSNYQDVHHPHADERY